MTVNAQARIRGVSLHKKTSRLTKGHTLGQRDA